MSLKLMIRPSKLFFYSVSCVCSAYLAFSVNAAEIPDESLQIHGFVAQGVIDANNSNFINADEKISLELTEVGINASYQLSNDFRIASQGVYLNGGNRYHAGPRLDYLVLEWDAFHNEAWQANLYFGRVKNIHWLYSSTRDIPFARPSIIIPQVTYFDGFRDIAVGGDGAAAKLSYSDDELGEFDFNFSRGKSSISDEQADVMIGKFALGKVNHNLDTQMSVYWRPSYSQWQFGISANDSSFSYQKSAIDNFFDSDFIFQFYTVNALYEGEFWQFSAELVQERLATEGFYFPGFQSDTKGQGYYAQVSYKLKKDLSVMLRNERFYRNKNDKNGSELERNSAGMVPAYFGFHNDTMIGLSYDIKSNFRINAEYHWMQGGARLSPIVQPDPIANDSKNWQVWAIQFMYWF
jgi:hypothetical protein